MNAGNLRRAHGLAGNGNVNVTHLFRNLKTNRRNRQTGTTERETGSRTSGNPVHGIRITNNAGNPDHGTVIFIVQAFRIINDNLPNVRNYFPIACKVSALHAKAIKAILNPRSIKGSVPYAFFRLAAGKPLNFSTDMPVAKSYALNAA